MIKIARDIFFEYIIINSNNLIQPKGIILNTNTKKGRVIFKIPTLLPHEHFIKLEHLKIRSLKLKKHRLINF